MYNVSQVAWDSKDTFVNFYMDKLRCVLKKFGTSSALVTAWCDVNGMFMVMN